MSCSIGTEVLSQGLSRPGREADHSPPSRFEVKMNVDILPLPSIRLHRVVRESFTLPFTIQSVLYVYTYVFICISCKDTVITRTVWRRLTG